MVEKGFLDSGEGERINLKNGGSLGDASQVQNINNGERKTGSTKSASQG